MSCGSGEAGSKTIAIISHIMIAQLSLYSVKLSFTSLSDKENRNIDGARIPGNPIKFVRCIRGVLV